MWAKPPWRAHSRVPRRQSCRRLARIHHSVHTSVNAARRSACATGGFTTSEMRHSHIAVIGVPLDLGAGRRGVDMGPSAVRVANLNARLAAIGFEVDDLGNVAVSQQESEPE